VFIRTQTRHLSHRFDTPISYQSKKKSGTHWRTEKRDRCVGSVTCRRGKTCDENVTIVTKLPFTGGSLSGGRDLLVQHADFLLRLRFATYQKIPRIDGRSCYVVATGKISKSVDKRVARKLWVVH
jgi:hypothetical protein